MCIYPSIKVSTEKTGRLEREMAAILREITEERRYVVSLVFHEALNNARSHGNKNDPEKNIFVSIQHDERRKKILIALEDEGEGFDFEAALLSAAQKKAILDKIGPVSSIPADLPQHFGLFLMQELSENLLFSHNGRRVEITIDVSEEAADLSAVAA